MNKKTNFQKGFRQKFEKVKTAKGRKLSSTRWLQRQLNDPFTKLAKEHNYRSRSAFKLLEIIEKYRPLRKAQNIIDLGCAPGGWLQVMRELRPQATILGVDLLEIEPIDKVNFIQGDFLEDDIKQQIIVQLGGNKADLIISDIAPATCGHRITDHIRLIAVLEDMLEFALEHLEQGGNMIAKIFLGPESDELLKKYKKHFSQVKLHKPESSRKDSQEQYLVALNRDN